MFHIAKVLQAYRSNEKDVIGADTSVQATVEMWDENILTIAVNSGIGEKIKENDIVLVDYSPCSANIPVPKQIAVKILRGETAKKTWKRYEEFRETKKKESSEYGAPSLPNVR